ncbi:probable potassium transporter 13 isoform X2 [Ricinus communis]|uniref:probable potassium transporter 13 isoform X2 n=1 Tax=Ricinus communis TaxID=3988 RepID=UPI00201A4EE7|nr:probable potassium transporter 13 isoform X2 [Ricinus communis]
MEERKMDEVSGSNIRESRLKLYKTTLLLAYQSFGVVYGDLCTSPLYVYKSTFSGSLQLYEEDHEIFGVLSLVFWTLAIIPLCKYIIFVLGADDNGGTFALYSLLCRRSKMGFLLSSHMGLECVSSHDSSLPARETRTSLIIKEFFEKHHSSRIVLLLVVLLGTSMVIGDGILTPTMSVLSAVYGIQIKLPNLHENYTVVIACVVLVGLFALQHYGTHRVGFVFAPILLAWQLCLGGIGIYNIFHWNPGVINALSPHYIYKFFQRAGKSGWSSLGGIILCVAGAEAMFADLGHFSKLSLRIAFTVVVYPCLVLAYMGEAAYLSKHKEDLQRSFYKAIPEAIFWPVFLIATLATVVGSQAIISATFSIISQCRALGCFPRVKIVHTSKNIHGQIYIPEVNWLLMVFCLAVVIGFRDTSMIGNAYGLAVIIVMFVTTLLMFLIISTVWKRNVSWAIIFVLVFGSVELSYLSACLAKVHKGGWLPLLVSLVISSLMSIWRYGTSKKLAYELDNKVSLDSLLSVGASLGMTRVPGICLVYSDITSGVPPMFAHFITNFPAFHEILIFVTLQSLMIPKVPIDERFHIVRIGPPEFSLFRCIVRYGYKDIKDSHALETQLIEIISGFLKSERQGKEIAVMDTIRKGGRPTDGRKKVSFQLHNLEANEEIKGLMEAKEAGVAYMMSNTSVRANEASSFVKKFAINIVYAFLRRNSRCPATALGIPHPSLIEVGMVYLV